MSFGGTFDLIWSGGGASFGVLNIIVNAAGDVVVTCNADLNESSGAAEAFTLDAPIWVTFVSITIVGNTITLGPNRPIYEGETVILDYSSGGIEDLDGNLLGAFFDYNVDNNSEVPLDTTAPEVSSIVANAVGDVVVTCSEPLYENSGVASDFTLDLPVGVTFTGISIADNTITLSPSRPIYEGETVVLDYTPGGIEDLAGNDLEAISNYSVTNNSEVDGTAPLLQSAVTDGYEVTLTYNENVAFVPLPSAYSFGGDPSDVFPHWVYGVGTTNVTIPLSKPIYQGQTLTITSTDGPEDAAGNAAANLTAQAVTNNSTRVVASLVTSGLVHDFFANAGVTHTGDGTEATAVADQSGTGSDLVPGTSGGPVYRATGWIDGTPMLEFQANDGLETQHTSVVNPFKGSGVEWTVMELVWTVPNSNSSFWWSVGDKFRVSGNHHIQMTVGAQQMRAVSNHTLNVTRIVTDYSQYTKAPFPIVVAWRKLGTNIQCFVSGSQLTYDDASFNTNLIDSDTFLWGRGWSAGNETGSALANLKRGLIYNRALTDNEIAQNTRALAILGGIPVGGALLGEAVTV